MPTYEYECDKCGHIFEKFQNMSDTPLKKCPKCGGKVHRLIGMGGGIILKGDGFYAREYGSATSGATASPHPSCGRDRPCCGRDAPCGKSAECRE
jgi:putative FmdB family regulatory protein